MIENRFVGMKSRGVYEAPGMTVLYEAHRLLEQLTLDRDLLHLRDRLAVEVAEMVYYGFWYCPKMDALMRVGLGYIKVGQQATTLSGGEAQRVKLSKELAKRSTGRTLYILDEPTTGLHFEDVRKLLEVLHELVEQGNTVIVIEHNLDVVKTADWIIDIGPEGGDGGGTVVACGTPEEVAEVRESHTGHYLKPMLDVKRTAAE